MYGGVQSGQFPVIYLRRYQWIETQRNLYVDKGVHAQFFHWAFANIPEQTYLSLGLVRMMSHVSAAERTVIPKFRSLWRVVS